MLPCIIIPLFFLEERCRIISITGNRPFFKKDVCKVSFSESKEKNVAAYFINRIIVILKSILPAKFKECL